MVGDQEMLRYLAKGLLGRLLGYGTLALGFWLLYRGFSVASIPSGFLGGLLVLGGLYLMVSARRADLSVPVAYPDRDEEDNAGDSPDGSGEGNKLPPQ